MEQLLVTLERIPKIRLQLRRKWIMMCIDTLIILWYSVSSNSNKLKSIPAYITVLVSCRVRNMDAVSYSGIHMDGHLYSVCILLI